MKKTIIIALVFLMLFSVPVVASNEITKEKVNGYERFDGEVVQINNNEKVNELLVQMKDSKMYIFVDKNKVMDLKTGEFTKDHTFSKGEKILFYIKKDSPLFLSEPPKAGPEIVAINPSNNEFFIDVDYFDKKGNGASQRLKINGLEDTKVVTLNGNTFKKKETLGKNLLVLYTASTRSIPPQTVPEKVVVLRDITKDRVYLPKEKTIIKGMEVYPIRSYYEKIGAKVNWDDKTEEITISFEDKVVKIDSKTGELILGDKKIKLDFFVIEDGISYSVIKLFEEINGYFID